jgi:hypothetical protein
MLKRCGFGEKWRRWIAHCISTVRFYILINDHPDSFNKPRGVSELARTLGCKVSSLPMKYMDLSVGAPFKAKFMWDTIIKNMEKRLVRGQRLYLSKGGQVTLIKSTLSTLLTYFLSLFPILVGVANRLEKLQRDFFWSGLDNESKFHLINWKVYIPL